jgi:hypothetical protein
LLFSRLFGLRIFGLGILCSPIGTAQADILPGPYFGPDGKKPAPPTPVSWFPLVPTMATAGADTCTIQEAEAMGKGRSGDALVAFRWNEGLVAWRQDEQTVAVRAIASHGIPIGDRISIPVAKDAKPGQLFAIERGFLLLVQLWKWQTQEATWWGIVLSQEGKPESAPLVIKELQGKSIMSGQPLGGEQVALLTYPAQQTARLALRWQTLNAGAKGRISATTSKVVVDEKLADKPGDSWAMAELDNRRGWVVLRDGVPRPYGIFAGVEQETSRATLLVPEDAVRFEVANGAVPPPHGPGRIIYEALGRPMLERTRLGKKLAPLDLTWQGRGTGVHAMNVDPHIFWSRTHFLRPFDREGTIYLLPVDCIKR